MRMCACRGTAGFAHVSCLAEQAKLLVEEAEENNLGREVILSDPRFGKFSKCGLCEQEHYGDVRCALGWACWKTYVGRPESEEIRWLALVQVGIGLHDNARYAEALVAFQGFLDYLRRHGAREEDTLCAQTNDANCLWRLGRADEGLRIERHVFSASREISVSYTHLTLPTKA